MGKKNILRVAVVVLLIVLNFLVFRYCNIDKPKEFKVSFEIESDSNDTYQVFYGNDENWSEERSQTIEYLGNGNKKLEFFVPSTLTIFRIDLGTKASNITLTNPTISQGKVKVQLESSQLLDNNTHKEIQSIEQAGEQYKIVTNGEDPFIIYSLSAEAIAQLQADEGDNTLNFVIKILICLVLDVIGLMFILHLSKLTSLFRDIYVNKKLIWNLSKSDFKTKYAGSYLGITWAFVQPIVTILVYWFVFEFGLKSGSPIEGVPFVVWFVAGLIPWFFFQDALLNATNCMAEYSYLVKKVVFKISILPIVKAISALFVHLVFVGFLFIVAGVYGFYPSIYSIQIIYYSFCTFCLALALSYATCSIIVFFKDLGQIINILLQVGMWMTPIMWSYTIIPKRLRWIVKLNPMYYVVEGYRDTFINHVWFWNRYFQTIFFWCVVLGIFAIGQVIFKKLKPHFADVL